jgi:2-oxoglutarate dehydrogenase E1 component
VIWEAQFGDFANGAQTIIDQFIASSESKWQRMNGLVMLLPHGYEGQGPEHSSARLERFLQLCAENNMTIANITTPANLFHLLRRQLVRPFRKPLVIMSPKSLLRHPLVVSPIDSFINGGFQELLDDTTVKDPKKVKKIIVCSGKVYYDLWEAKEKNNHKEVAIVRLEQIYPFPKQSFEALLQHYPAASLRWVQEEPLNAGAWQHIATHHAAYKWSVTARPATASPAAGAKKNHDKEQALLMEQAFS